MVRGHVQDQEGQGMVVGTGAAVAAGAERVSVLNVVDAVETVKRESRNI